MELPRYGTGVRGLFAFRNGKCIKIDQPKKIIIAAPFVHQDTIPEVRSMATIEGKKFTSRSAYKRHLKQHGFRESGGKHLKLLSNPNSKENLEKEDREWKETIEQSYYDVKYDRVNFTEAEKEKHLREQREWKEKWKLNPIT